MRKKGTIPTYAVFYIVLFVVAVAIYSQIGMQIGSGKAGEVLSEIDKIKLLAFAKETCVTLTGSHAAGAVDTETVSANVQDAYAFGLYFDPGLVSFTGSWALKSWKVSCEGADGKTYNVVNWPYYDFFPKGYLPVDAAYLLPRKNYIDVTKKFYVDSWNCKPGVTATVETADVWGGGTGATIKLCYYTQKTKV